MYVSTFSTEGTYRVMSEWVICVKEQKKSNEQIKKPGLRKAQEWLELVIALSKELPSLELSPKSLVSQQKEFADQ